MDIAWLLWGVLGGVVLVTVVYAVVVPWLTREKPSDRPVSNSEIASRVDELGEAVDKLLKVYRSNQMKRVRAAAKDDDQTIDAVAASPVSRKAQLRAQLFKIRGNN